MRRCHGQQGVGMRLRRRHVAAALADEGDKVCCIGQCRDMVPLPGQGQRLLTALPGLLSIA